MNTSNHWQITQQINRRQHKHTLLTKFITDSKTYPQLNSRRRSLVAQLCDEDIENQLSFEESYIGTIEEWADRDLAIATVSLALAVGGTFYVPLTLGTIVGLGYMTLEVWKKAYDDLVEKRRITVMTLEGIFLPGLLLTGNLIGASVCYWSLAAALKVIEKAKGHTMHHLTDVFGTPPHSVWIQQGEDEVSIPFESVRVGDVIVIQGGEMIPIDGMIMRGFAGIDERMLTGESQPVTKEAGDSVFAGTIVLTGSIYIEVEKTGTDTVSAEIGKVLHQTSNFAASIELRSIDIADRWAGPLVAMSAVALPLLGPAAALSILWAPIDDAMIFGGPLSMLNYLSLASRAGFLVKDGRALELLNSVDTIVFDKTGTLTLEQPTVGQIYACGAYADEEVLQYAAAAEHKQTHPIAQAILQAAAERHLELPIVHDGQYQIGYGIKVQIGEQIVQVGSAKFMAYESIQLPNEFASVQNRCYERGSSLVFVAIDDQLIGAIELCPTIRPEAKQIVRELKERNYSIYIMSGDHEKPTRALADELGIEHYFSETLPENKANLIRMLQQEGRSVCFVGDGINDALALKVAQVSISLQGASTVATNTAQIILMNGDLTQLMGLFALADELDANMRRNILIGAVPTVLIVGGVYFLHLGLYGAAAIYTSGLIGSMTNAMLPLVRQRANE